MKRARKLGPPHGYTLSWWQKLPGENWERKVAPTVWKRYGSLRNIKIAAAIRARGKS